MTLREGSNMGQESQTSDKPSGRPDPWDILSAAADAVVVFDRRGGQIWADDRFETLPFPVQDRARQWCSDLPPGGDIRTQLTGAGRCWEILVRPMDNEKICCLMLEVTESHAQRLRAEAIDAAGMLLLHFNRDEITDLTVADRLRLLEKRIVASVRRELKFDHFEIRLRSPGTNRLELVIAENMSPLRIGETISASKTGNGISGWVAATGQSYICGDVQNDPLYREGLTDARSSLTVPLIVHGSVIGVFNIESDTPEVFTESDQVLAERFAGYIASVLHLLDMLVVERVNTSQDFARSMTAELDQTVTDLQKVANEMSEHGDGETSDKLQGIAAEITRRVAACAAGPRSIIDAEHEIHSIQRDEVLAGMKVLIVDDEERVRTEVTLVLKQLGCDVSACSNGTEAFATLESVKAPTDFELVVSDIRLPDASGYEVFTKTRSVLPEVPVILMTGFGYDPDHTIVRASADGVQGVLLKPFRTSQFIEAIRNAIGERVAR
ncbi:MAG: response regulator [Phycisphaerales bacterium]|nr:response regulator [Phycisphaerales bacterium]